MEIKKVSIIGCGALGVMYASHMSKNLPPGQIQFIADQERIDRYREKGIYANGARQAFSFATPDADTEPSDLVIFAVKFNHLRDAVRMAKRHIGEDTVILSFLNGISSEEIIGETYDPRKIIYSMVAGMDATKTGYSVDFMRIGYVAFGSVLKDGSQDADIDRLASFFEKVRMRYEIPPDIMKTIWWKYILNIGINQTSALIRATYGLYQTSPYAEKIMRMAMDEAYEVSKRLGIGLGDGDIDSCVELIRTISPNGKTSMCQDVEAKRPTEVDMFAGTLIELAEELGVPVPVNTFLWNAIKAVEEGY